jgi:hypothetical protein
MSLKALVSVLVMYSDFTSPNDSTSLSPFGTLRSILNEAKPRVENELRRIKR